MTHLVSQRAENDLTLYINIGENESSRKEMGRNQRFEESMNHSRCSSEIELNLGLGSAHLR